MDKPPPILSRNTFLRVCMICCFLIGVWPMEFIGYPRLRKLYDLYKNILYVYYWITIGSMWTDFYFVLMEGKPDKIVHNLEITILLSISLVRVTVVRGDLGKKLIRLINEFEVMVFESEDEDMLKVYKFYSFLSRASNLFFYVVGFVTMVLFCFLPSFHEKYYPEEYIVDNVTGKIITQRLLPVATWYPWNINEYYTYTFCYDVLMGFIMESFVVMPDMYMFSCMMFAVSQMKILQHVIMNFHKYTVKLQNYERFSYEASAMYTAKSCIKFHKEIIEFVEQMDSSMKYTMLLDFLSCSFQMSVILFQIIMAPLGLLTLHAVEFLVSMIIQMFLFYWNANEIIVESQNIARAVYRSEWYNESKEVQQMMKLMMLRAQKPLTVSIGPFYPMSTDTSIAILKATYSYGMLLRESYNRKNANSH